MAERHSVPLGTTQAVMIPLLAALLLIGCAQPRGSSLPVSTGCPLVASTDSSDAGWPLTVAMGLDLYPVSSSGPGFPGTRPERFTTHQVGETLIRLDCRGDAVGGLASRWSVDSSGHFWTFTLRPDPRFTDGTRVTAADVSRSFAEVRTPRPWVADGGMLVGWAGIRRATLRGDTALVLEFAEARRTVPPVLAHPALVIVKQGTGGVIGSGAFHVALAAEGRVRLEAENGAALSFTVAAGDLRDALDAGVDVVVTRDARTLGYARGLDEYTSIPLPWADQYVLVTPNSGNPAAVIPFDALRLGDIVRVSARSPSMDEETKWWRRVGHCRLPVPDRAAMAPPRARVVYAQADAVARSIAERLVAVAGIERHFVAVGMPTDQFRASMRTGGDWGYVVRLPTRPLAPCLDADQILEHAPWLAFSSETTAITALLEVRSHAVVQPPRVSGRIELDWQGELVILAVVGGGQ